MSDHLAAYWVDDDHVWRYDTHNPGPGDEPRAVGPISDGWMLSDAVAVAIDDDGTHCACDACTEER